MKLIATSLTETLQEGGHGLDEPARTSKRDGDASWNVKIISTSLTKTLHCRGHAQGEPAQDQPSSRLRRRGRGGRRPQRPVQQEGFWAAILKTACESPVAAATIAQDSTAGELEEHYEYSLYESARTVTSVVAEKLQRANAEIGAPVVFPGLCEVSTRFRGLTSAALAMFMRRLGNRAVDVVGDDGRLAPGA